MTVLLFLKQGRKLLKQVTGRVESVGHRTTGENIMYTRRILTVFLLVLFLCCPVLGLAEVKKEYYPSGKLRYEWNYKNGKKEGIGKEYYESGKIEKEYNFKDGKQDGITKRYYKSGELSSECTYKEGKEEGISKYYYDYESGALRAEFNYKGGKKEGISRVYYPNGEIQYIDTYKNGQRTNRKAYDEKGKLEFEQDYTYREQ